MNEGVPRTFHSARNLNARVPRTCFENILPGSCTENIYASSHFKQEVKDLKNKIIFAESTQPVSVDLLKLPVTDFHQLVLTCVANEK